MKKGKVILGLEVSPYEGLSVQWYKWMFHWTSFFGAIAGILSLGFLFEGWSLNAAIKLSKHRFNKSSSSNREQ